MDSGFWMEHAYLRLRANGSIVWAGKVWSGLVWYGMIAASQDGNEAPSEMQQSGGNETAPRWPNTSACK